MTKALFTILFLLLTLLTLLGDAAEAVQRVLALQSVPVVPYEQALKGFESAFPAEVRRFFLAELKEKDVLRTVRELRPDMVLALGRDALTVARRVKNVPVVYCMVLDPASLLAGEKNISGVSMNLPAERQLSELVNVLPGVNSISLLYNPVYTGAFVQDLRSAAGKMKVRLAATAVHRPRDVPRHLSAMRGKDGLFWMLPDITVITPETVEAMLLFSLESKMPIITFSEQYLELGAMLAIGIDAFDIGSQAGEMAQRMLVKGDMRAARHVDARKALLSVNMKIVRKLGIHLEEKDLRNNRVNR